MADDYSDCADRRCGLLRVLHAEALAMIPRRPLAWLKATWLPVTTRAYPMASQERLERATDAFWQTAAHFSPRPLRYWTVIDVGVRNILDDEEVPGVPFVTVLERLHARKAA